MTEFENKMEEIFNIARKGELILWVGAGFSIPAGLPSGNELMKMLIHEFLLKEEWEKLEENSSLNEVADRVIYSSVDIEENKLKLSIFLKSIFFKEFSKDTVYNKISCVPYIDTIVSTNYDNLFELAYEDNIDTIYDNESYSNQKNDRKLYKIHGDICSGKKIVLSKWDYEKFIADTNLNLISGKIKEFFATKTILFVGFSFDDINIGCLYREVEALYKERGRKHYYMTPNEEVYKINKLNKMNIEFIKGDAEKLSAEFERLTKKYLLRDLESGKISYELAKIATSKEGFIPEISTHNGIVILEGVSVLDEGKPVSLYGEFSVSKDSDDFQRFSDVVSGNTGEMQRFSNDFVKEISMKIQGFDLHESTNITDFIIVPCPKEEGLAEIYYQKMLFPVNMKYKLFQWNFGLSIELNNDVLNIKIIFNADGKQTITYKYNIEGKKISQLAINYNQIEQFFDSNNTLLKLPGRKLKITLTNRNVFEDIMFQNLRQGVKRISKFYQSILKIEKTFDIEFSNLGQENITDKLYHDVCIMGKILDGENCYCDGSYYIPVHEYEGKDQIEIEEKDFDVQNEIIEILEFKFLLKDWKILPCKVIKQKKTEIYNNEDCYVFKTKKKMLPIKFSINYDYSENL